MKIRVSNFMKYIDYVISHKDYIKELEKVYKNKIYKDIDLLVIYQVIQEILVSRGVLVYDKK